jgi:anaerobic selenocysteine-containing dehydrogenase
MSDAVVKLVKNRKQKPEPEKPLSPNEARALAKLQAEAKAAGATLATGGKGGLPPSTVLGVMRRDGPFQCRKCGGKKDLSIHHKAGAPNLVSKAMRKQGHSNDPKNLATICQKCHDDIHDEDREAGEEKRDDK